MSNPQEVRASYVDGRWNYTVTGYGYESSNEALEAGGRAALKINPPELAPPAASAFVEFDVKGGAKVALSKAHIVGLCIADDDSCSLSAFDSSTYDITRATYDRLRRELLGI